MRDDYQKAIDNSFDVQNTQGVEIEAIKAKRLDTNYTNKDLNWKTGTHSGDIYISMPDVSHNLVEQHHAHMNDPDYDGRYQLPENGGYPGIGGFFTNEDTASHSFTDEGEFDSVRLGHDLQQAPHFDKEAFAEARANNTTYFPEYNGHLDCFRVNSEKMQEIYGTTDFYAAMSKCTENIAWGEGGGFQGYNPYINEMINNGSLEYVPEKSRVCTDNACIDYADKKNQASGEAAAVHNHIEGNGIHGKPGERLGHNEISQKVNLNAGDENGDSSKVSSANIESIGGGGAHAPDTQQSGELPPQPPATVTSQTNTTSGELPPPVTHSEPAKGSSISGTLPSEATTPALKEPENRVSGQLPAHEQPPALESGNRAVAQLPETTQASGGSTKNTGDLGDSVAQNLGDKQHEQPLTSSEPPLQQNHTEPPSDRQISGALPSQPAESIDLPGKDGNGVSNNSLAQGAEKQTKHSMDAANGIT